MDEQALFRAILDQVDEGMLYLDGEGRFRQANRRARQMLGTTLEAGAGHPGGHLEPGDIVVLADNALAEDDGGLTAGDLALLGIDDPLIAPGDMLVGAGRYRRPGEGAVYRHVHSPLPGQSLKMECRFAGHALAAEVDGAAGQMHITVDGAPYSMSYLRSIGQCVVLDGATGRVKFYQDRGYTLRRETLADLLRGQPWQPKGAGAGETAILGERLTDIIEPGELTRQVAELLAEGGPGVEGRFYDINKRLTLCSLLPMGGGVLLKLTEASELERLMQDRNTLLRQIEHRQNRIAALNAFSAADTLPNFAGDSPAMLEVKYLAWRASKARFNVLLTGESGTGKSRLAWEIHKLAAPDAPFVEVNCTAIPYNLFESELFGHVAGAFTGALQKGRAGHFEAANGGTIFLDEIGELPMDIQVKLLQVLQTKRFYRVGSTQPVHLDVRVIAATNKDLAAAVRQGAFRQDLYYRLNVFPIWIPPLRQRRGDLPRLIDQLTRQLCAEYGLPEKKLTGTALETLLGYDWPGNVRELANVLERAIAISDADTLFPEDISLQGERTPIQGGQALRDILAAAERRALVDALERYDGSSARAMALLGVSKSAFYAKLAKYGIDPATGTPQP